MTLTIERPADLLEPIVDDGTRREFIAGGLTLAALLAGCGSDDGPESQSDATQVFTDSTGRRVRIPIHPKRIVSLHEYSSGQALLSIGAPLVGLPLREGKFDPTVAKYDLSDVKDVGEFFEYKLEAMVGLRPDLIVALAGQNTRKPNIGTLDPAKLEAVAPTIYLDQFVSLNEYMDTMATITGLTDEVQRQRKAYEAKLATAKAELTAQTTKGLSFAQVAWYSPTLYVTSGANPGPLTQLALQLGMTLSPVTDKPTADNEPYAELSEERLTDVDVDVIIADKASPQMRLWKRLAAVKAGQATITDVQLTGGSYASTGQALDILKRALKGVRSDVVDESKRTQA